MKAPKVSVIISFRGQPLLLKRSLDSLQRQRFSTPYETMVADSTSDKAGEQICRNNSAVTWIHSIVGQPQAIAEAMQRAQGQVVVLTDSCCTFAPGWLQNVQRSHGSRFRVIGGAVDSGDRYGLIDWACYFADYGPFMLPADRRVTPLLPGNHVSYKRELLDCAPWLLKAGFHKHFFHEDLVRMGESFLFDPDMVVRYLPAVSLRTFCRDYYRAAREYARMRTSRISASSRWLRLLLWPLLVPLLLFRRVAAVAVHKRHLRWLALTVPILFLFVIAWAAGEAAGYLRGRGREQGQQSQGAFVGAPGSLIS